MKKYYIELYCLNSSNYIMQSKWYDTEEEALKCASVVDYLNPGFVLALMASKWDEENDTYTDIIMVREIKRG